MTAQILLFVVLVVADLALWIAGITAPLSATWRYRAIAGATLLLAILCGSVIGWPRTVAASALALWLAAILAGNFPGRAIRSS